LRAAPSGHTDSRVTRGQARARTRGASLS
jgi:hypothetical protein